MGSPYLAFAWPPDSEQGAGQARAWGVLLRADGRWSPAYSASGLQVWTQRERPAAVTWSEAFDALIIGCLAAQRAASFSMPDSPTTFARQLCAHAWGAYVALRQDAQSGETWAFRDPSGALDALTWRQGALAVLASDLDDLPSGFAPGQMRLDWDVITDFVRRPWSVPARAALTDLETVTPGDAQRLGAGQASGLALWRPADVAGRIDEQTDGLEARLAATVAGALSAWAAAAPASLVEVSGGFDSAVVATLLRRGPHGDQVRGALNYFSDRRDGDERGWAQQVCDPLGLCLTAVRKPLRRLEADDLAAFARCARPTFSALDAERDRDTVDRLRASGAEALFTGYGGDALFYQMGSPLTVTDQWRELGLGALADPFAAEVAAWLRRSIWSVWRDAWRGRRRSAPRGSTDSPFLGPRAREPARHAAHPWLEGLEDLPPGKRLQIEHLTASLPGYGRSRRGDAAMVIQPLLSQPVMELCLAIPSWRLVAGARDRALARRAFAPVLPAAVAERRSKGALSAYYAQLVSVSLDVLRPHLLDGALAEAGVLDRAAMEAALQPDALIWTGEGTGLLSAAVVESWVRHWQGRAPDSRSAPRARAEMA
jgi:asparagine synthase (glutamine-hydrolysing)